MTTSIGSQDSSYLLTFGHDEAAAAVAACRESIIDIVRGSIGSDGEYHPNPNDDPAVLPLARIAVHAATNDRQELPVTDLDMHFLKLALKRFSNPGRTKKAVGESSIQFGTINNGEIEQRVTLGQVAGRLLTNIDPEFAVASTQEVQARYLSIVASAEKPDADVSAA